MSSNLPYTTQINGRDATKDHLSPLAFSGYAHFTAMQVRGGAVRGLDLHLERLRSGSRELFGRATPDEVVYSHLTKAVSEGPSDLSLTVTMFSQNGEFTPVGANDDPAVMVRTSPPSDGPDGPVRLMAVEHERPLATVKHVGEVSKTLYLREAVQRGYEDALFIDSSGNISEATIWNAVFWDGSSLVWPQAEILQGITMQIIRKQIGSLGVSQRMETIPLKHVKYYAGAALMNSWTPGVAVKSISGDDLPDSDTLVDLLHRAYRQEPSSSLT